MTTKEMLERRAQLGKEIRKLADLAEGRGFTEEEQEDWDRLNARYDELTTNIERRKRTSSIMSDMERRDTDLPGREDTDGRSGPHTNGDPSRGRPEIWRDARDNPVPLFGRDASVAAYYRSRRAADDDAAQGLGLGQYLRAYVTGARTDAEERALSSLTAAGGGTMVPMSLLATVIDLMRAKATIFRAGAKILMMDAPRVTIARNATDPTVAFFGENAPVPESDPTFDGIVLNSYKMGFMVRAPRELIEDAPNLEMQLQQQFAASYALKLDKAALFGGDAGEGGGISPDGLTTLSGVNQVSMGVNGAAITNYDEILDTIQLILEDNGEIPTAAILAPRSWTTVAKFADTTGQPLQRPADLQALTFMQTTQVPVNETQGSATDASRIVMGGFERLIVGVHVQMQIHRLQERYASNDQIGFLVRGRFDVVPEREEAFGQLIGVVP